MTSAECEIVANAGVQLREIAERLTVPYTDAIVTSQARQFVRTMDACALAISEVYGALASLPIETETEHDDALLRLRMDAFLAGRDLLGL